MGKHSLLSASSAHRWLHCTPSARLEEQFEDTSSEYAEEGTAAHELAEWWLRRWLQMDNATIPYKGLNNKEMHGYIEHYVEFAFTKVCEAFMDCADPLVLIEQRLDYSEYAPEGFGTGDLVIMTDGILEIIDLKYGKGVRVSAEDNPQMKLYALGALSMFGMLYDVKNIRMTIFQPRLDNISTYEVLPDELLKWAETTLRDKAESAFHGEGEFEAGEHCRFCKAKYTCEAKVNERLRAAQNDFNIPIDEE